MGSVVSLETLLAVRKEIAVSGRRVVFTNGYFDLLHVGHTQYLQRARALGDALIVAVNADATARRAKDSRRPIVPQEERAELVAALGWVDYVVIFEETTAERLVSLLQPDIYAKGGDYDLGAGTALPEAEAVEAYGGEVVILPFLSGHSTTELIQRIVGRYCPPPPRP